MTQTCPFWVISSENRARNMVSLFPNLVIFSPMLKHHIRAYLTFWSICCAGIDIPYCLRVKIRRIKIILSHMVWLCRLTYKLYPDISPEHRIPKLPKRQQAREDRSQGNHHTTDCPSQSSSTEDRQQDLAPSQANFSNSQVGSLLLC